MLRSLAAVLIAGAFLAAVAPSAWAGALVEYDPGTVVTDNDTVGVTDDGQAMTLTIDGVACPSVGSPPASWSQGSCARLNTFYGGYISVAAGNDDCLPENATPTNVDVYCPYAGNFEVDAAAGSDTVSAGSGLSFHTFAVLGGSGGDLISFSSAVVDGSFEGQGLTDAGPGEDSVYSGPGNDILHGGDDSDRIYAGSGADQVFGDGGDDFALNGEEGNDTIDGGAGDDHELGEPYDHITSQFRTDPGSDTISGGSGFDWVSYEAISGGATVRLDGQANDGADSEGDNVANDVEEVVGGPGGDTFIGNDNGNTLEGGSGPDTLDGAGGNDTVRGDYGPDTVNGGAGDDSVSGGEGDDKVNGGPGSDSIFGDLTTCCSAFGNDQITANDGTRDQIDCGPGGDTVTADGIDIVASDGLSVCESVTRTGPSGGGPGGAGPGTQLLGVTAPGKLKAALSKGLKARVRCAAACQVTIELRISAALAKKLKLRSPVVGSAKASLLAAGDKSVRVRFKKAAKAKLRRLAKVKLTVRVKLKTASGSGTTNKKLTLKR